MGSLIFSLNNNFLEIFIRTPIMYDGLPRNPRKIITIQLGG